MVVGGLTAHSPRANHTATDVASTGQPQGVYQGTTTAIVKVNRSSPQPMPMTSTAAAPWTTAKGHQVAPQDMLNYRLAKPRCQYPCQGSGTNAMPKGSLGSASQPSPITPECIPMAFLKQTGGQPPMPTLSSSQQSSATKLGVQGTCRLCSGDIRGVNES